jgi:hypothetical protein
MTKAALPPALHALSSLAQRHNLTQLTRLYYSLPLPALNCSEVRAGGVEMVLRLGL